MKEKTTLSSQVVTPNISKYPISNFAFDIFPVGDTIWFASGSGIMRTIDHFNTFQNYFGISPFGEDDIPGFMVKDNLVVVGTSTLVNLGGEDVSTGTGIKVSTDRGNSWSAYPQPMDGRYDTTIVYGSNNIYTLPVVVPQMNISYSIAVTKTRNDLSNYTIWITSFAGGLRKSTDYGSSWQRVILPPDNLDSIYITGTGYTFSLNVNQNYNQRAFSILAVNDSTFFVGTANGINKSTDWGLSWRKYNYQNSGTGTNRVSGNFVVNFYKQKYGNNTIVWAATRKADDPNEVNALSYSTNNGLSWAYTLKDISPNGISSDSIFVYAQTDDGLWRASFGTFDWSKNPLIYDETTKDILKTSKFYCGGAIKDTLYFGTADGLVRTKEIGLPWGSKWKIFRAIQQIDLSSDTKSYAAPNPFSPADEVTRIYYKTGKSTTKITIKVYDFGMSPVRTLIQNAVRTSPDELFTMWDGKNNDGYIVPNGVYFYRIEIDSDKPVWGKIIVLQ